MPWKSDQQRKWGNSPAGLKALGSQAKVNEFNQASIGMKLPSRIGPDKHGNTMMPTKGMGKKMGTTKHGHDIMGY